MILAIKNKIACYYNSKQEKSELLATFKPKNYRVFCDTDIKRATNYAKTKKITGFKIDKMTPLEIFQDLKGEGIKLVSFETKSGECRIVILNNIYMLNTKKYIDFDLHFINIIKKTCLDEDIKEIMENIIEKITRYKRYYKIPLEKAAYQYFFNFERNYKQYPWVKYNDWHVQHTLDLEYLVFENICENISVRDSYNNNYYIDFKKYKTNYKIKESDILNIKEVNFDLVYNDPQILKSIKNIENGKG